MSEKLKIEDLREGDVVLLRSGERVRVISTQLARPATAAIQGYGVIGQEELDRGDVRALDHEVAQLREKLRAAEARVAELEQRERMTFTAQRLVHKMPDRYGSYKIEVEGVRFRRDCAFPEHTTERIEFEIHVDEHLREFFGKGITAQLERQVKGLVEERDVAIKKLEDVQAKGREFAKALGIVATVKAS